MLIKVVPDLFVIRDIRTTSTDFIWSIEENKPWIAHIESLKRTLQCTHLTADTFPKLGFALWKVLGTQEMLIDANKTPAAYGYRSGMELHIRRAKATGMQFIMPPPDTIEKKGAFSMSVVTVDSNGYEQPVWDALTVNLFTSIPDAVGGFTQIIIPKRTSTALFENVYMTTVGPVTLTVAAEGLEPLKHDMVVTEPILIINPETQIELLAGKKTAPKPPVPVVVLEPPQYAPTPGTLVSGASVEIVPPAGAHVTYYTIDGTIPNPSSVPYTHPIKLTATGPVALKAVAFTLDGGCSPIAEGLFLVIPEPPCIPTVLPRSGGFVVPLEVILSCSTPSVIIHYTLDGTVPNEDSPVYVPPLILRHEGQIPVTAAAFRSGVFSSCVRVTYRLQSPVTTIPEPTKRPPAWGEFVSSTEDSARGRAQEIMAAYITARRKHTAILIQSKTLQEQVQELDKERGEIQARVDECQRYILERGPVLREVEAWNRTHVCKVQEDTENDIRRITASSRELKAECIRLDAEANDAEDEYRKLQIQLREAKAAHDTRLVSMKELFVTQGVQIQRLSKKIPQEELESLREALAEQRHEIAELQAVMMENPGVPSMVVADLELPSMIQVNRPRAHIEVRELQIPPGGLMKINGPLGNGLQGLRFKHSVDAEAVVTDGAVGGGVGKVLRLRGEMRNVDRCEEEIWALLRRK